MKKNSNASSKPKVIIIAGPTAVGKTALSLELAQTINSEIISADSMQIYQRMQIGTAAPTVEEKNMVKHHLVNFIDPINKYSVADYATDARGKIDMLINEGKVPIVSGGTGLYIHSLLYKLDYAKVKTNPLIRTKVEQLARELTPLELHAKLANIDAKVAKRLHPNNTRKVSRALEIALAKGHMKDFSTAPKLEDNYDFDFYVINRDRAELYNRINRRVELMIEQGLIEEVKDLLKSGLTFKNQAMQGIGYKETMPYFNKEISQEELIKTIQQNSRRYAKRQLTWFRRYNFAKWIEINTNTNCKNVVKYIVDGL